MRRSTVIPDEMSEALDRWEGCPEDGPRTGGPGGPGMTTEETPRGTSSPPTESSTRDFLIIPENFVLL